MGMYTNEMYPIRKSQVHWITVLKKNEGKTIIFKSKPYHSGFSVIECFFFGVRNETILKAGFPFEPF